MSERTLPAAAGGRGFPTSVLIPSLIAALIAFSWCADETRWEEREGAFQRGSNGNQRHGVTRGEKTGRKHQIESELHL